MSDQTLTEFLLARIAEDEACAKATPAGSGEFFRSGLDEPYQWRSRRWYVEEDGKSGWAIGVGVDEEDAENFCVTCNDSGGNELIEEDVRHMVRWDPDRALAECEAKRRIVLLAAEIGATIDGEWACCHSASEIAAEMADGLEGAYDPEPISCAGVEAARDFLQPLALPYADHPDYQQEWAL